MEARRSILLALAGVLCAALLDVNRAKAIEVDVALVLAVDVSTSMDLDELTVQRKGYVEALRHPDFLRAVRSGRTGRVALAYFEWAGSVHDAARIPWTIIDDATSADAFAARLDKVPLNVARDTSISNAIAFARMWIETSGITAERRTIDISGDGPNNFGPPVEGERDAAIADGIVVNGLPILIRPSPLFPAIDRYYAACVIGGAGSFLLPVRNAEDFETAIRRKLVVEVSRAGAFPGKVGTGFPSGNAARQRVGSVSRFEEERKRSKPEPAVQSAALRIEAPVDCLVGERARARSSGRYYPELDR